MLSTVGLAHDLFTSIVSLGIVVAGYFHDGGCDVATKACGKTKRSGARLRSGERSRCSGSKGRRLRGVVEGASTDSGAGLGAKVSRTGLCGGFAVFLGEVGSPNRRGHGFWRGGHVLKARNRDMSHENVAKGAIRGCEGTFYFFEKSKTRVVELRAVAVKVLPLLREDSYGKSNETGAEFIVDGCFVQRVGFKVHLRQRDSLVRLPYTDANNSPTVVAATSEANGDGGDTGYFKSLNVPKQPLSLHVLDMLDTDHVADVRQSSVLDRIAAAAEDNDYAIKK